MPPSLTAGARAVHGGTHNAVYDNELAVFWEGKEGKERKGARDEGSKRLHTARVQSTELKHEDTSQKEGIGVVGAVLVGEWGGVREHGREGVVHGRE